MMFSIWTMPTVSSQADVALALFVTVIISVIVVGSFLHVLAHRV